MIQQRYILVLSASGHCEQFWHGQGCPLSDVVHPALPLPNTATPSLQGAPKDGFGEAVVACDMPEPRKFSSLDSCQKRFLWTHKEADLAPHPVVGLVLQVAYEMRRSFVRHLVSKACLTQSIGIEKKNLATNTVVFIGFFSFSR